MAAWQKAEGGACLDGGAPPSSPECWGQPYISPAVNHALPKCGQVMATNDAMHPGHRASLVIMLVADGLSTPCQCMMPIQNKLCPMLAAPQLKNVLQHILYTCSSINILDSCTFPFDFGYCNHLHVLSFHFLTYWLHSVPSFMFFSPRCFLFFLLFTPASLSRSPCQFFQWQAAGY